MSNFSSLSTKNQITIPPSLCAKFNLKPGIRVSITGSKEGILIQPLADIDQVRKANQECLGHLSRKDKAALRRKEKDAFILETKKNFSSK